MTSKEKAPASRRGGPNVRVLILGTRHPHFGGYTEVWRTLVVEVPGHTTVWHVLNELKFQRLPWRLESGRVDPARVRRIPGVRTTPVWYTSLQAATKAAVWRAENISPHGLVGREFPAGLVSAPAFDASASDSAEERRKRFDQNLSAEEYANFWCSAPVTGAEWRAWSDGPKRDLREYEAVTHSADDVAELEGRRRYGTLWRPTRTATERAQAAERARLAWLESFRTTLRKKSL